MSFIFPIIIHTFPLSRPKVKAPPQDILLKLQKEQSFKENSEESSKFVFKLGLSKLKCCLLMNGIVLDSSEVLSLIGAPNSYAKIKYLYWQYLL